MAFFTEDYLDFFKELAAHNHKDWFDVNRKRYEKNVKKPFENFVNAMIAEIAKQDDTIDITHKEAVFRINRDIRFSKNKEPYKLNRSAIISPKGKKDKAFPGLYMEAGPEHFRVYSGVYMPDKEQLYTIRESISKDISGFQKMVNDKKFKKAFGEIRGDKNKIIPKEFKEAAEKEPLIFNKQFYWFREFEPEIILEEDLLEKIMEQYTITKPLMDYLGKAMK